MRGLQHNKLRIWFLAFAAVLCAMGLGAARWWRPDTTPQLWIASTEIRLPQSRTGQSHTVPIAIENRGGAPLTLDIVGVTCGCSSVSLANNKLLPGESTMLIGTIQAPVRAGGFSTTIGLATNDPALPFTEILLAGGVEPYLIAEPGSLLLQPDMQNEPLVPLRIRNTSDETICLAVNVSDLPVVPSVSRIEVAPGATTVLDFSCPIDVIQYQQGYIRFEPERSVHFLRVPIEINPVRGLEVHPARLMFGMLSREELLAKRFTVILRGPLVKSVRSQTVYAPQFMRVVEERENDTGTSLEIYLEFTGCVERKPIEGVITIDLSLTGLPMQHSKITVPVGGVIF